MGELRTMALQASSSNGGMFTDNTASTPPGVPAPSGSVLTLTVDAQSFGVTDFGVTDTAPDLTQIGPVVNLDQWRTRFDGLTGLLRQHRPEGTTSLLYVRKIASSAVGGDGITVGTDRDPSE